jgi:hypothetical protein
VTAFLHTRSRKLGDSVLLTFGDGIDHGGLAAMVWLGRSSMVVGAPSSDALAPRTTPATVV